MQNQELLQQIQQQLQAGIPRANIIDTYTKQGYKMDDILMLFKTLDSINPMAPTVTNTDQPLPNQQTIPSSDSFSIGSAISAGWHLIWQHIGFILLVWVFYFIICTLMYIVSLQLLQTLNQPIIIGANLLLELINAYISIGIVSITIKYVDGIPVSILDLFPPLLTYVRVVFAWILSWMIIAGGLLMGIIPGIYWMIELVFSGYYVIDKNAGPLDGIKASSILTRNVKWKYILLQLTCSGIMFLGMLCLFFGILIAFPITLLALAAIYRSLEQQRAPTQHLVETKLFTIPKIIALFLGGIVGCVFIIMVIFPQIDYIVILHAVYPKQTNPLLYVVPKTVQLPSQTILGKQMYSFENLSFQLPWNEAVQVKDRTDKENTNETMKTSSGKELDILSWGNDTSAQTLQTLIGVQGSPALQAQLNAIYGPAMLASDFTFFKIVYASSPDEVTLNSTGLTGQQTFLFTTLKKIQLAAANTTDMYYAFSTSDIQGFVYPQQANPIHKTYVIDAWDHLNNKYTFLFIDPSLSPQDINTFLSSLSLHPAVSSSPTNNLTVPNVQVTPGIQSSTPTIPAINTLAQPTTIPPVVPAAQTTSITVENNVTLALSNLHADASNMYATVTFTNNASSSQQVNPSLHVQSGNQIETTQPYPTPPGTQPGQVMFTPITLSPGQTTQISMSFTKLPSPITISYESSNNTTIKIGTYTGQ